MCCVAHFHGNEGISPSPKRQQAQVKQREEKKGKKASTENIIYGVIFWPTQWKKEKKRLLESLAPILDSLQLRSVKRSSLLFLFHLFSFVPERWCVKLKVTIVPLWLLTRKDIFLRLISSGSVNWHPSPGLLL